MENNNLTGIERQLVLQYLIDGNVPVTVTPTEKNNGAEDAIQPLSSAVFPVALKAEQIASGGNGIILLKNPPQSNTFASNFISTVSVFFLSRKCDR